MIWNSEFDHVKRNYENTKPIRGRSVDVRPLFDRRRDWEQVCMLGTDKYSHRLYSTDCVIYEPKQITLKYGIWPSVTTAEFISRASPFKCQKSNKALWVYLRNKDTLRIENEGWYPIYKQMFVNVIDGVMIPQIEPVPVRVVNRVNAKKLRSRLNKLLEYGTAILKLSDGWITREFEQEAQMEAQRLNQEVLVNANGIGIGKFTAPGLHLLTLDTSEEKLPAVFIRMLQNVRRIDARQSERSYENRYSPSGFKNALYKFHDSMEPGVYDIVPHMPDGKVFSNITFKDA